VGGQAVTVAQGPIVRRRAFGQTRRAIASRASTGHIVMVVSGALGVLLTLTALRAADASTPVLVAARDLAPGSVIGTDDVRVARVHADASVLAGLVAGSEREHLLGRVVMATLHPGDLLARDVVQPAGTAGATRVMSFPIARARAVGGRIVGGDRVDVVAVDRDSKRGGYVLADAEVVSVDAHSGGALSGAPDDVTVTLAVGGDAAPRLAAAVDTATVMLVRSTGAAPLPDRAPFVPESTR